MRSKKIVILTIVVIVLTFLSATLGLTFMYECVDKQESRLLFGLVFMNTPVALVILLTQIFRKDH